MSPCPQVLQFLVVAVAGWINQQQRDVIDSLQEEHRVAERSSSVLAVSGSPTPSAGAWPPRPRASGDGYAVTGTPGSRPIPSSAGIDR